MEQISRDQQKVRLFPTGQADDPPEALPDGLPQPKGGQMLIRSRLPALCSSFYLYQERRPDGRPLYE